MNERLKLGSARAVGNDRFWVVNVPWLNDADIAASGKNVLPPVGVVPFTAEMLISPDPNMNEHPKSVRDKATGYSFRKKLAYPP
jgi:hypothetical protein